MVLKGKLLLIHASGWDNFASFATSSVIIILILCLLHRLVLYKSMRQAKLYGAAELSQRGHMDIVPGWPRGRVPVRLFW